MLKHKNKNIIIILIMVVVVTIFTVLLILHFKNKKPVRLLDSIEIPQEQITDEQNERMLQVEKLKKENDDIVGWLEIEGTSISYPVLQGTDNDYYMTHTYNKKYSKDGSIFLDKNYNWNLPSTNLLIYGHNNNNGVMFNELLNYEKESYYKEHQKIRFTTIKEDAEYEIISVFKSRVYYQNEKNVFRYYFFINANNESEFNDFIDNCKKASLYDTSKSAKYGEQLITLSTCSYHTENGRFAVVAKKVNS